MMTISIVCEKFRDYGNQQNKPAFGTHKKDCIKLEIDGKEVCFPLLNETESREQSVLLNTECVPVNVRKNNSEEF